MKSYSVRPYSGGWRKRGCVLARPAVRRPRAACAAAGGRAGRRRAGDGRLAGLVAGFSGTEVDWGDKTVPQRSAGGHRPPRCPEARSSAVRAASTGPCTCAATARPTTSGSRPGAKGWDYGSLLPYFKRSETAPGRDAAYRGTGGPMLLTPPARTGMLLDSAFAAAVGRRPPDEPRISTARSRTAWAGTT